MQFWETVQRAPVHPSPSFTQWSDCGLYNLTTRRYAEVCVCAHACTRTYIYSYAFSSHVQICATTSQDTEQFHHHRALSCYLLQPHSPLPVPMSLTSAVPNLFSISILLSFHQCSPNGIRHYIIFLHRPFLTQHGSTEVHWRHCPYE